MKTIDKIIVVLLILFIFTMSALAQEKAKDKSGFPALKGPYFGQKPPGKTPELFAPEIMDAEHGYHFPVIFSPDLTEAFWKPMERGHHGFMYSKMSDGVWSPDGGYVLYTTTRGRESSNLPYATLWIYDVKTGKITKLTPGNRLDSGGVWSN